MHTDDNYTHAQYTQVTPLGRVAVDVFCQVIKAPPEFNVPYEGSNPLVAADFPDGFPPSFGSAIAFKHMSRDGVLEFFCISDRGPNGDGPAILSADGKDKTGSKFFPSPSFSPSIGVLRASASGATLVSRQSIMVAPDVAASGLPIPHGSIGSADEVPLFDSLQANAPGRHMYSVNGIDSEALAWDPARNVLWISEEYGPYLLKVDPASGLVMQRYGPGTGLPAVMRLRRANRGMEGMTMDTQADRLHAFLQSPLSDGKARYAESGKDEKVERYARFLRWIEFDPEAGRTTRLFAYPLDAADYADGRTGNAKLGDLAALGDGKFAVIEQGEGPDGVMVNRLMLVDLGGATDISAGQFNPDTSDLERSSMSGKPVNGADWSAVRPLGKTLLLNLNDIGWVAEKAEGLALVDERTLAMTNDNDFGLASRLYDASGKEIDKGDIGDIDVDAQGNIVAGAAATDTIRISKAHAHERPLTLWLLRFEKPLAAYALTS